MGISCIVLGDENTSFRSIGADCCAGDGERGAGGTAQSVSLHDAFDSKQAYGYMAEIAGLGERWPGSPGHAKTEEIIHQVLRTDGAQIEADDFVAQTPRGAVNVHNIIGKFNCERRSEAADFYSGGTLRHAF
jgi:hypothetical protein